MGQFSEQALTSLIIMSLKIANKNLQRTLAVLCMNPNNCYKIIDAYTFIMLLSQEDLTLLLEK
jgi:hypothetical protein